MLGAGVGFARTEASGDPFAAAAELAEAVAALHRGGRVHGGICRGALLDAPPPSKESSAPASAARSDRSPLGPLGADLAALDCAAPEVLRGRRPRRASDVHALAMVVASLVSGTPAEPPSSVAEAVHRGLRRPPLVLGDAVPPRLARLLHRAVSRRPWVRPSAAALARALRDARRPAAEPSRSGADDDRGALSRAPPARDPEAAPASRRRLRALAAASALAVMAVTGALLDRASALERAVSARLDAGDPQGARRLVRDAERRGASGPLVDKLRGDVACAARAWGECLARYEAALRERPGLARDRHLRDGAFALAATGEYRGPVVTLLARLPGIDGDLVEMTGSQHYWTRWNAVRALEARGALDRVDMPHVYVLDLLHGGSCDTRRAAAAKLAAQPDPRFIPELTQARESARSSFFEWLCTGSQVEEALRAARQARVAAR